MTLVFGYWERDQEDYWNSIPIRSFFSIHTRWEQQVHLFRNTIRNRAGDDFAENA